MNRIRLDNWIPHELKLAQEAPEPHVVLVGTCYSHPLKEDGAEVATGKITAVKVVQDGYEGPAIVAQTVVGTEYELLDPARRYEEVFPNAREKIFEWWYASHPEDKPIVTVPDVPEELPLEAVAPELEDQPLAEESEKLAA